VAAIYEYETQPQPTLPQDVAFIQRHFTELAVEKLYLFIENERHRPRLERLFREIPVSYSVEWVVGQISEGFIDVAGMAGVLCGAPDFQAVLSAAGASALSA
jgi:hypothetical protein